MLGNNVFDEVLSYVERTESKLRERDAVQRELAEQADLVAEIVCGLPVIHKGSPEQFGLSSTGKEITVP